MKKSKPDSIEMDMPPEERPHAIFGCWFLGNYMAHHQDEFSTSALNLCPEIIEHLPATITLLKDTPFKKPLVITGDGWVSMFITFDLARRALRSPDFYEVISDERVLDGSDPMDFDTAAQKREEALDLFDMLLDEVQKDKPSMGYPIDTYLRLAKRLPPPGGKGRPEELAPLDAPYTFPKNHPVFKLSDYHHTEAFVNVMRFPFTDMVMFVFFMQLNTILEVEDNLPARIINAYFPDFNHYFKHVQEGLDLQPGTPDLAEIFKDPNKHVKWQRVPEPSFGALYMAHDFAAKLLVSSGPYRETMTLMTDRFGIGGEAFFQHTAEEYAESSKSLLPVIANQLMNMRTKYNLENTTVLADYDAFSKEVLWWD